MYIEGDSYMVVSSSYFSAQMSSWSPMLLLYATSGFHNAAGDLHWATY